MKKLICLLFVFVFLPIVSFAEYPLSKNEQNFVGSWCMYADNGNGKIYAFMITFLDSREVVQCSMTFKNGTLATNNKASGEWGGFSDKTIVFTLAGSDMTGMIKDDGYLYLYFFKDLSLWGIFSKCEDMTGVLGW